MTHTGERDNVAMSPAQERFIRRARGLMLVSSLIMALGILAVFGVIAYRLSAGAGRGPSAEATVSLPRGARIVSTAVTDGKLVVTIEIAGVTEVRVFDLATLEARGRVRFTTEP